MAVYPEYPTGDKTEGDFSLFIFKNIGNEENCKTSNGYRCIPE